MIIEQVDMDRECFRDYTLEGTILSIGDIPIDLEAAQEDQEVILTYSRCGGYIAEVLIPPRRYETVEIADEVQDEGEQKTHTESVPVPLDVQCVVLKLWPMGERAEDEGGLYGI